MLLPPALRPSISLWHSGSDSLGLQLVALWLLLTLRSARWCWLLVTLTVFVAIILLTIKQ